VRQNTIKGWGALGAVAHLEDGFVGDAATEKTGLSVMRQRRGGTLVMKGWCSALGPVHEEE
jgi:hypothetical protein